MKKQRVIGGTILSACIVIATGCADSHPTAVDGPAARSSPMAQVFIRVDVSGDPAVGPQLYWITLDGYWWTAIDPARETPLSLSRGVHTVGVGFRDNTADLWCAGVGQMSYQMTFASDQSRSIHFDVNCPPLSGSGTIDVSIDRSGRTQPSMMSARFNRLNGPAVQDSFDVDVKALTERTMPPGVYSVDYYTKGCSGISTLHSIRKEPVIVRDGAKTPVQLQVTCPLPFFP